MWCDKKCGAKGKTPSFNGVFAVFTPHIIWRMKVGTGRSSAKLCRYVQILIPFRSGAMHLLRSGVDINTIRIWLGHVSLQTTHLYAESDLKMKAKALARCEAPLLQTGHKRTAQKGVMGFLKTL
jgi:hypothetical protein